MGKKVVQVLGKGLGMSFDMRSTESTVARNLRGSEPYGTPVSSETFSYNLNHIRKVK